MGDKRIEDLRVEDNQKIAAVTARTQPGGNLPLGRKRERGRKREAGERERDKSE